MPLVLLHAIGAVFGYFVYYASPKYRRRLNENLSYAFPNSDIKAIRHQAIAEIGKMAIEIPKLWFGSKNMIAKLVNQVSGWELVEAAHARGRGIIFITPHLGCFEICASYYAHQKPITVLYRPHKKIFLRPVLEQGRPQQGVSIAPTNLAGVKLLLKALHRGEAIGLLPDHVPSQNEGIWVDFFGKPAFTMTLAARLSEGDAAVLFVYAERLPKGKGYHLHYFNPEIKLEGDIKTRTQQINQNIEQLIYRCPGQYLWSYNRYKPPLNNQEESI